MKIPFKLRSTLQTLVAFGLLACLAAALLWYSDAYVNWQPKVYPFALAAVFAGAAALTLYLLRLRDEKRSALAWKTLVSLAIFPGIALVGLSYLINNVFNNGSWARLALSYAIPLSLAYILFQCVLLHVLRKKADRPAVAITAIGLAVIVLASLTKGIGVPYYMKNLYSATVPTLAEGRFASFPELGEVDFTVPGEGNIEQVRDLIREARGNGDDKHFTVLIEDGEYNITQISFDERDHDTTYRSRDGGVILNGGLRLDPKEFTAPGDGILSRLSPEAQKNVKAIDLTELGLTAEDWGKLYSFGGFTTAGKYGDGVGPLPCELFFNGKRCTMARYPNGDEWLKVGEVIDNGDAGETFPTGGGTVRHAEWADMRNPRGGTFMLDKKTAARAAKWTGIEDVWVFGCFKWDWADMSSPVKAVDNAVGALTTEYASTFGFAEGGTYYFYNVLEELDEPGEWYLDRDGGLLYLWPPEGDFENARLDLSLSTETLITGEDLKNMSFTGLTLQGTRGDAIALSGDNLTVEHCLIQNIAGSAVSLDGYNNTASNNEIRHVGAKGITIGGGDAETLTPGNSRAVNNLVHDWPEVIMVYQGGVHLNGTGNLAAHNEFYNSPHTAIFFSGNNHVIEYNLIRNVCMETDDAGAIYSGRSLFSAQGTVIRNNAIFNLGNRGRTPCGIYLDDGLSGVTVENNLLVNVPDSAIAASGRDLEIHGNVIVNAGKPISYDQRMRNGALATDPNFWFYAHSGPGGNMWRDLEASPWQTEPWKVAYPKLAALSTDFAGIEDPGFAANPAGSSVTGNVFVGPNKPRYDESVLRFSTIGPNGLYKNTQMKSLFADAAKGNYCTPSGSKVYDDFPEWQEIPLERVGRTNFF
jgi:hypothetical protein